jgi:hypothetical protein
MTDQTGAMFQLVETEKYPLIYMERVFDDELYNMVLDEMIWLQNAPIQKDAISSHGSYNVDINGSVTNLKNNSALFLNEVYAKKTLEQSIITNAMIQTMLSVFDTEVVSKHWYFGDFHTQPFDHDELISYYGNNQEYGAHRDNARFTVLVWMCKDPKSFSGGEFYLPEIDKKFDFVPNSGIIIPSKAYHQVLPVNVDENAPPFSGRFAISSFVFPVLPEEPEQNQ